MKNDFFSFSEIMLKSERNGLDLMASCCPSLLQIVLKEIYRARLCLLVVFPVKKKILDKKQANKKITKLQILIFSVVLLCLPIRSILGMVDMGFIRNYGGKMACVDCRLVVCCC